MDLESDTSRWNGTSESYCVGLCSLRSLEISGSDDSIGSDLSSFTSLLNNIAMCSGQCVSSDDDGTKVYPLSSTLTHLDLSSNDISDPTVVSLQPGLSGVTHLTLSDNSISDLALLQQVVDDSNSTIAYVDVSDNRLDCGSTVSECLNSLADICERDISGSGDGNDGVEVVFGDVDDSSGDVSQDTTSSCGSDPISTSSVFCSYSQDHLVCQVNDSADDDGSEYLLSSSSSACSNCGGERGTCVYDADSDSSDESLPFCECSDGWYGTDCSSICPVSDDLGLCSGSSRGTCDAATHICVCESGYYGSSCNLYCDSLSRCGLHGRCSVGDLSSSSSSETLYCECDAGWNGSTCFTQYPVETVEYVNDDDETNPTIVDYVCGINYSTDPSSSYSDYAIYSSDTDTYSCDCSSYGLITDASTSTCIDPATHPEYKDIAGNDTACLTCGTTTDSHGTCVLGEGEDSLTAMCQCEYGWGNDVDDSSEPSSSCSVDMCGVSKDAYTDSKANPSSLCSSHGICYWYNHNDSTSSSSIPYGCACDDGWNGTMCDEEDSNALKIVVFVFIITCIFIIVGIIGVTLWFRLKNNVNNADHQVQPNPSPGMLSEGDINTTMTVVQVRDNPLLSVHEDDHIPTTIVKRRQVKKSKKYGGKGGEKKRNRKKKIIKEKPDEWRSGKGEGIDMDAEKENHRVKEIELKEKKRKKIKKKMTKTIKKRKSKSARILQPLHLVDAQETFDLDDLDE
ncbi:hypothetical protein ADUPG1_011093 [Aduncisulcus paluster]|uniref:EGF-like domain-containing protein n=1 Tax=Aduncisulcus paluster TaxID=2918883 RepID=A0ABQ5JY54_9EUKA|nr:hypothetical protein ADUPG1_011093 [Aduncisulcus paluster]